MTPDEQQLEILKAHTSSEHTTAPRGVVYTAASLVRAETELASHSTVQMEDESTTWRFDIVVGGLALAHGVIHYNAANYYASQEDGERSDSSPVMTVREAWVRKLNAVAKVDAAGLRRINPDETWYAEGEIVLTFDDGTTVQLPSQDALRNDAARDRSDRFHNAIREAIGF